MKRFRSILRMNVCPFLLKLTNVFIINVSILSSSHCYETSCTSPVVSIQKPRVRNVLLFDVSQLSLQQSSQAVRLAFLSVLLQLGLLWLSPECVRTLCFPVCFVLFFAFLNLFTLLTVTSALLFEMQEIKLAPLYSFHSE